MKIEIYQLLEGAKQAKGLTVIIDVFRAFSLTCYMTLQGAKDIIPVGEIQQALDLKQLHPDWLLIGERKERIPLGFDAGNSPTHVLEMDLKDKTIVHTTSAGTQGLVNATDADEIITGSFVNAPAIVRYIKMRKAKIISLVCMGYSMKLPSDEDTFCAEYIKNSLEEKPFNYEEKIKIIKNTSGQRLFDPANQSFSPESDFYLCTQLGRFDFVLKAEKGSDGLFRLHRINC